VLTRVQEFGQNDRMIVHRVLRRIEQRRFLPRDPLSKRSRGRIAVELVKIARPELIEAFGPMAEPDPKLTGRGDFLCPEIDGGFRLCKAPWPKTID
jgi:hypothetical protein